MEPAPAVYGSACVWLAKRQSKAWASSSWVVSFLPYLPLFPHPFPQPSPCFGVPCSTADGVWLFSSDLPACCISTYRNIHRRSRQPGPRSPDYGPSGLQPSTSLATAIRPIRWTSSNPGLGTAPRRRAECHTLRRSPFYIFLFSTRAFREPGMDLSVCWIPPAGEGTRSGRYSGGVSLSPPSGCRPSSPV